MIYFVSTPIGNLEDITLRALNTLKSADIIACEDTRTSQKLLAHYNIRKKLISFHKFNEISTCEKIIQLNNEDKNIAIISDAGMPVISDPGNVLTKLLRERNINFTIIPGANAALSALVLSGLDATSFHFLGFLPEKKSDKINLLQEASLIKSTLIFYVSPHNLEKDIEEISSVLGNRQCALVKEITKLHETTYNFSLSDTLFFAKNDEDKKTAPKNSLIIDNKGEFVFVVEGMKENNNLLETSITDHVKFYIKMGLSKNDAIKRVAKERGVNKNAIYQEVLKI